MFISFRREGTQSERTQSRTHEHPATGADAPAHDGSKTHKHEYAKTAVQIVIWYATSAICFNTTKQLHMHWCVCVYVCMCVIFLCLRICTGL